jgi:hypothetical protein
MHPASPAARVTSNTAFFTVVIVVFFSAMCVVVSD